METVKIPLKIFTSYEALTEYYGENNTSLELGMYESSYELVVGHAPTAYSFSPQYFTGEVPTVPNYVPDSPFTPPTEEPTPTTEAPTPTTQAPVVDYSEPFWIQPEYKANIAILNNLNTPMSIQYSTDKTNWTTITDWNSKICYITSAGQTTTLTYDDGFAGGTKIWFRGTNTTDGQTIFVEGDDDLILSFNPYMEGSVSFNTGGNIMSLVYGANFTNQTTLPNNVSIGGNGHCIRPFVVMYGPTEYQVNALNMINSAEELLAISTDWYIDMYDASVETYPIYDIETITGMCDYMLESSTGLTEIHCTAIYNDTEYPCNQFLPTGVAGPNAKFYVNPNTQIDWTQLVDTAEWTILIEGTNTPWSPSNN